MENIIATMKKNWQKLSLHLTKPPRLESSTQNARVNAVKKKKKIKSILPKIRVIRKTARTMLDEMYKDGKRFE